LYLFRQALRWIEPSFLEASVICMGLIALALLVSVLSAMQAESGKMVQTAGCVCAGVLLLQPSRSLIYIGTQAVGKISDYGRLLLPVMTASLAAQGGGTTAAALYTGTVIFDTLLSNCISGLLVPMLYIFLCLCVAYGATGAGILGQIGQFVKWLMTWGMKIILYVFTGYMGITGVISGTADAAALKAAKLTISGVVPVVGGILSDASEAVLVGTGVMRGTVGIYGTLAVIALTLGPFVQIGTQYLMLKATTGLCGIFGAKGITKLAEDVTCAMGICLAMTGTTCLLFLISIVCFMKGVG
jgi:stage III sporulation protein AE